MKVIGAGLPRTATLSQKIALETLGLGPCYHMVDVLSDLDRTKIWREALEGRPEWNRIFDGYQSTVDWPGSFFYQELMDVYPDAKVLLSVRSGESWARSMNDTVVGVLAGDCMMHDLSNARSRVDEKWAGYIELMNRMWESSGLLNVGEPVDLESLEAGMERHNEKVKAAVPADRLLVWSAVDGWEPLCEFLEVPVPDAPFPRVNDSAMFADRIIDAALAVLGEWRAQAGAAAQ